MISPRPMPCVTKPVTSEATNPKYSIRGTVIEVAIRESGWWIFKNKIPIIRVRINEDQLNAFNRIANEQMAVLNEGTLKGITSILDLGLLEENISKFPVRSEVGITFEYSSIANQYFLGRDPLRVSNLQVINENTILENEICVP